MDEQPSFDEIRRDLLDKIRNASSNYTKADLTEARLNVPRSVLDDPEIESEVEALYNPVGTGEHHAEDSDNDGKRTNSPDYSARLFRRVILGDNDRKSRAKILAFVLAANIDPTKATWRSFLHNLDLGGKNDADSDFWDDNLPFSHEEVVKFFGAEDARILDDSQHEFCPVDLESKFGAKRKQLKDMLDNVEDKSLVVCKSTDRNGHKQETEINDSFCPNGVPEKIVKDQASLIKQLYVESCKARDGSKCSPEPFERRQFLERVKGDARTFYDRVQNRAKVLSILIINDIPAMSDTWRKFVDICMDRVTDPDSSLDDSMLPLSLDAIQSRLGKAHSEIIYNQQFRFCAAKVKQGKHCDIGVGKQFQRLPLIEKQGIGYGSFGTVYRVLVRASHFQHKNGELASKDQTVAMKVMSKTLRNSTELGSAQWFQKQLMSHDSILRVLASLTTSDQIYIFFPLANCNLREYMVETDPHCLPSGPKDFDDQLEKFNLIINIAEALEYLHCKLQDDEHNKLICIHEDLKAENILVFQVDGKLKYKITDFGISSIKFTPAESSGFTVNRNLMFTSSPRALRDLPTKTTLGNNLPNFAPEATEGGSINASVDVWALGTVLAEYLAWLSGGAKSLRHFEKFRGGDGDDSDFLDASMTDAPPELGEVPTYYLSFRTERHVDDAGNERHQHVVKEGIWIWFRQLVDRLGRQDQDQRLFYERCWQLLEYGLLVCDPNKRAKIETVGELMSAIMRAEDVDIKAVIDAKNPQNGHLSETSSETPSNSIAQSTERIVSQTEGGSTDHTGNNGVVDANNPQNGRLSEMPSETPSNSIAQSTERIVTQTECGSTDHTGNNGVSDANNLQNGHLSETPSETPSQAVAQSTERRVTQAEAGSTNHTGNNGVVNVQSSPSREDSPMEENGHNKASERDSSRIETKKSSTPSNPRSQPENGHADSSQNQGMNAKDDLGCTELLRSVKSGQEEVALRLLEEGADGELTDNNGYTALHFAVRSKCPRFAEKLLDKYPTLINQMTWNEGQTALHHCAKACATPTAVTIASILLKHNASPNIEDKGERTPLEHATELRIRPSSAEMVKLLLDNGADRSAKHLGRCAPQYRIPQEYARAR